MKIFGNLFIISLLLYCKLSSIKYFNSFTFGQIIFNSINKFKFEDVISISINYS